MMLSTISKNLRDLFLGKQPPPASSIFESTGEGPYCSIEQLMSLRLTANKLTLPSARKIARPQSGSHRSRFRGRGMEFSEVRAYQPGDDVRSIDWRVTARRQKPHTKLFNEERERPVFIVCDQSQSQFFGSQVTFKSVRAAESSALFAWSALEHNDRVGGLVFSEDAHQEIKPARSRKQIMAMLSAIVEFNQKLNITNIRTAPDNSNNGPLFDLNRALTEAFRLTKPGTLIVLISDFRQLNLETDKLLSKLAKHNELIFVRTYDPLEEHLPKAGHFPVSNGYETLTINANSNEVRTNFDNFSTTNVSALTSLSRKYRAPLVNVSTHQSSQSALQSMLSSVRNS